MALFSSLTPAAQWFIKQALEGISPAADKREALVDYISDLDAGRAEAAQATADLAALPLASLALNAATELTINGAGAITVVQPFHSVDTAGDAASDNLDTISGGESGGFLVLFPESDARTVVIRHAADNIQCWGGQNVTLAEDDDMAFLIYTGTVWVCLAAKTLSATGSGPGILIGALASLTTTATSTLVAAINELDADMGADASTLTTTATAIVEAINELDAAADDHGACATARCTFSAQPADGDTLTIGADIYEFVDTAVNTVVNADTHIAVKIGALAANTLANLVLAINGAGTAGTTDGITLADTVTPAIEDGTESLLADAVGTFLRIRSSDGVGGTEIAADPSIVLAESITDAADIWDVGNVNMNTLAGSAGGRREHAVTSVAVTAAMITNGLQLDLPFTVAAFRVTPRSSAGVIRANGTDTYAVANDGLLCTFGGGAAPDVQATDVLDIEVWSAAV